MTALGPDRLRAGLERRGRTTEGRVRSGVKEKSTIERNTETGFGDTHALRGGAAARQNGEVWGRPDTTTGFRPILSIGECGLWEPRSSSRCVPIPSRVALCQNIGYDTMRMPNLLGHDSPAEAVQQSASWLPLLARECHPDARIFLCPLFAPICLQRFISPCRSLCESVRDSCAPIMSCYGYSWPEILHCDQYPADHLMCISSVTNNTVHTRGRRASCLDCGLEEASSSKETLQAFCRSDFIVKLRLTQLKHSPASLSQFSLASKLEVLKHEPLLGGDASCVRNMTRHHSRGGTFVVTGTVQGERLVNLMAAVRKLKCYRCRS
uniref:FZ domain-containing protein n=1 Tax=Mola mola TaxID=94237 RepID=A0A3Q3WQ26_MOLML